MLTVPALKVQQFAMEFYLLNVAAADVERMVRFEVLGQTGELDQWIDAQLRGGDAGNHGRAEECAITWLSESPTPSRQHRHQRGTHS